MLDQWIALLTLVAARPWPIGVDVPGGSRTSRTATGPSSTRCCRSRPGSAVVAFADHARGPSGIVSLAGPAVVAASAAGLPFTVGVETDTAEVAGGAQYTFAAARPDGARGRGRAGPRRLRASSPGYEGVTVEHHRAWRRLLGLDATG